MELVFGALSSTTWPPPCVSGRRYWSYSPLTHTEDRWDFAAERYGGNLVFLGLATTGSKVEFVTNPPAKQVTEHPQTTCLLFLPRNLRTRGTGEKVILRNCLIHDRLATVRQCEWRKPHVLPHASCNPPYHQHALLLRQLLARWHVRGY